MANITQYLETDITSLLGDEINDIIKRAARLQISSKIGIKCVANNRKKIRVTIEWQTENTL